MQSDHTCEYVYSVQMDQFKNEDQPMTVTATAQITCESSEKNFKIAIFNFYVDVKIYQILLVHSSLAAVNITLQVDRLAQLMQLGTVWS